MQSTWTISKLTALNTTQVYACDGRPILNAPRGEGFVRFVCAPFGYLDFDASDHHEGGLIYLQLTVDGQSLILGADAELILEFDGEAFELQTTHGGGFSGRLKPLPRLHGETTEAFHEMMRIGIVPYQDPPPPAVQKTNAEIQALGDQYFPDNSYRFELAMSLYDWTSSDFIRQDLFNQLQYTSVPGCPLDLATMARVIFGCSYPGYSYKDANFMNQFLMTPATSEQEIYDQLLTVYERIKPLAIAEMNVYSNAVVALEPPTVAEYPQLYRGAMSMSGGYNTGDFAPSMFEFPGNAGPTDEPLYQAFEEALQGILSVGSVITTKGPWSFSNDMDGAKQWQNGILITLNPPEGATVWPGCADITKFSINPQTFEIDMPPPTRYRIDDYEWITITKKNGESQRVCHFTMTLLGYCVEPF
ncbi:MAG: hypothetical protein ACPGES_04490 [Coraliomargarita sp.]